MNNNIFKSRVLLAFFAALIFTGLHNAMLAQYAALPSALLLAYAFCNQFALFYLLLLSGGFGTVLIPAFFVVSSMATYYMYTFKVDMSVEIVAVIAETSFFEAREFVDLQVVGWILLSALLSLGIVWLNRRIPGRRPNWKVLALLVALIAVPNLCFKTKSIRPFMDPYFKKAEYENLIPFSMFDSLFRYVGHKYASAQMGPLENAGVVPSTDLDADDDLIAILIVGESARGDRFSLNGYERDTNPRLSRERNLISFPDAHAFAALTRLAVPIMITDATSAAPQVTSTSFLDVYEKHGFSTAWISLNDKTASNDTPISRLLDNVDEKCFREQLHVAYGTSKDHMMLPVLRERLAEAGPKTAIVLHGRGSHYLYEDRYTDEFEVFVPAYSGDKKTELQALKNAYDNSIVMTDHLIWSVIEAVRDKNAFVMYASDHGESLGEDGYFAHGNSQRPEQLHIPWVVWCSDEYVRRHPERFAAMKATADMRVSQDYMFPTLMGLAGIRREHPSSALDLTGVNENAKVITEHRRSKGLPAAPKS